MCGAMEFACRFRPGGTVNDARTSWRLAPGGIAKARSRIAMLRCRLSIGPFAK